MLHPALERLYARQRHGIKPGLETIRDLLARLGNPERRYPAVHVAGSNGKGSVCALLASIFRALGFRTGLYTSPHLMRFHERFRVDGVPIADADLFRHVARIEALALESAQESGREPTFFECSTALALQWFHEEGVDLAVVEVGMGGRLDSTNVVQSVATAITGISLEHTAFLGKDLASIAREKGGIVKPGVPLVCGETEPTVLAVLREICASAGSPLTLTAETVSVRRKSFAPTGGQKVLLSTESRDYGTVALPLQGRHQLANLAVAAAAAECALDRVGMPEPDLRAVRRGIAETVWPARFQTLEHEPPTILDAAHNPGSARVLGATFSECMGDRPMALVLGMCDDKDLPGFLNALPRRERKLWAVALDSPRSMEPAAVANVARSLGWDACSAPLEQARRAARDWALQKNGAVLITGSIYLAGTTLALQQGNDGTLEQ